MADVACVARDSFLEPLGLHDVAERVRSREDGDVLYRLVLEYAEAGGALVDAGAALSSPNELPLILPGTPVSIRLSRLDVEGLKATLLVAVTLLAAKVPPAAVALGSVVAFRENVALLKAEHGERSVVDALSEVERPTAEAVALLLHGKTCRYPTKACRFMTERTTCGISREAVATTLESLVDRGVLNRKNSVEPIEYGVGI